MTATALAVPLATLVVGYLVGSIPWAYVIVRSVKGTDVTDYGTGNVGAMNVKRATGSWGWFVVAMILDGLKGLVPALAAKLAVGGLPLDWALALRPWGETLRSVSAIWYLQPWLVVPLAMVAGAVLGHNYSLWMAVIKKRFTRTGKGMATGAGALLGYDWRYFAAVVVVGLLVIALTRYMMAGQVAASWTLPATALLVRSPDWPFALVMGAVVYAAHHKRFMGLLRGEEPRMYTRDRMGPRG